MPICMQNLAVSLRGWSNARKGYGKVFEKRLSELMRSQWFSGEQFREIQILELRKLLREAVQNVPHYKRVLRDVSDSVDKISLDSLHSIPILEKDELRSSTERFFIVKLYFLCKLAKQKQM